jgi:UDP-glucuronate 4-epimerase
LKILVTGAAGFIGMQTALKLLRRGDRVLGIDNLNDYYDVRLKRDRLHGLSGQGDFSFVEMDIADRAAMAALFANSRFERVIHLAAQAGVRYSLTNPAAYVDSNLSLVSRMSSKAAARTKSSISSMPRVRASMAATPACLSAESDNVDHPVSLYAATKKANELMAHTYSHLYRLPTTGLRFFTVYGPWGRPDMAAFPVHPGDSRRAADRRLQPRPDAARLHLHRRHRRSRRPGQCDRLPTGDPGLRPRPARPGDQRRALPRLQHRQPSAGATH